MRATRLLAQILDLKHTRVTSFVFEDAGLVIDVVPTLRIPRCSRCHRKAAKVKDRRQRKWRHLDLAGMALYLRYSLRRVDCHFCGVIVEEVPWAAPGVWFTTDFEQTTAYFAQKTDRSTVAQTMGVSWKAVGRIADRVAKRLAPNNPLDGLTHIGIDELSYRRHHEYVTVVVDHLQKRIVWAHPGKNADTLRLFFEQLGPQRCAKLEAVTIDMSKAYIQAVTEATPKAQLIFDRFHVQRLGHNALDDVRRDETRAIRGTEEGKALKKARFALHKRPWNLSELETQKVAAVQKANRSLYRGYLLKESLAGIFDIDAIEIARCKLEEWIGWARRSRLEPFVKLSYTIEKYQEGILAYIQSGLTNARTEALNGKIRTITRRAYGFHNVYSLIGLIHLCCSGLRLTPVRKYPQTLPLKC